MSEKVIADRGWYIAIDNQGKPVPVGRGLALGGWWWCPTVPGQRDLEKLPKGWVLGPSFKECMWECKDAP